MDQCDKTVKLEDIVPEYNSKNTFLKKLFYKRMNKAMELVKKTKSKKVMDAGCGVGIFSNELRKKGYDVTAIDYNNHINQLNKKFKGIKFIKKDLNKISYDEEFDAVLCLDVLEHIKNADEIINKLNKSLKINGYLIVTGPTESFMYKMGRLITKGTTSMSIVGHHYDIYQINDMIISDNFEVVEKIKIRFFFFHLFDVILYKKIK